jgi:hypothetical protein
MLVAGEGVVRDVVSRFGAVNIGIWCQGDISVGEADPRGARLGGGLHGELGGGQKCRSFGGWWVECSSWWRGMADLPGVMAGMGVVLTVVPSLGRGGRRKWPNLVVIWQLGGGVEVGL